MINVTFVTSSISTRIITTDVDTPLSPAQIREFCSALPRLKSKIQNMQTYYPRLNYDYVLKVLNNY